jgi:hypothetical protein
VEATPSNDVVNQKHLEPLNQKMTNPIQIINNRPTFHSYPNLEGLYLLLRSTGIIKIVGSQKEKVIKVNEEVLNVWRTLNTTEQYFSLFTTWLFRSEPAPVIVSKCFGRWPLFTLVYEFYQSLSEKGFIVDNYKNTIHRFTYVGFFNISLMRDFGMITIQEGKPDAGKGWRIIKILPTTYGQSILEYTITGFRKKSELFFEYDESYEVPCNIFQPFFQSCFPAWQNSLSLPENEFREGIFIFKVSLGNVWRRIEIDGQMTLEELADTIIRDGFRFDKDHLYAFYYKNLFGSEVEIGCPYSATQEDTTEVRIGDIPLLVAAKMKFVFDFGDNWEFTILLEEIKTGKSRAKLPRIIEKHGKAPEQYPDWDDEEFY